MPDSNGVVLGPRNPQRWSHFSQPALCIEKFLRLGRLHYEDNISSPEFVPTNDQLRRHLDEGSKALDKTNSLKHRAKLVR